VQQVSQQGSQQRSNAISGAAHATAIAKHQRALALYTSGQFESAAELLRQALLEAPSSELANDIGAAELACGRREQALSQFFLATSLDPANIEAVANLGTLLAHMNRMREAIPHLQKAASKTKDHDQRLALEKLLAMCGNKLAERVLEEARVDKEKTLDAASRQAVPAQPAVARSADCAVAAHPRRVGA
jgi:tetratricopeptide (TPR) repeat protein